MVHHAFKDVESIQSTEIKLLAESLPYVLIHGLADSTVTKYYSAWNKWLNWCKDKPEVQPRPAEPFFVAIYLNFLLRTVAKKGCISAAMYGIRWGHRIIGLPTPTNNSIVQLAFEGCLRLCPGKTVKKEALPVHVIKDLVDEYCRNKQNLMDLRFVVICLLGFAGFFRIDEVLSIQLKHLSFFPNYLLVTLEKSKTDQHRKGNEVFISVTESEYCPVTYVKLFLQTTDSDCELFPEAFLIPRLHKTKSGHSVSRTRGISYTTVYDIFKAKVTNAKPEHSKYCLHSLRSGGASAAAKNGVSDRLIAKQGRWSTETARDGYIEDSVDYRLKPSSSLGL